MNLPGGLAVTWPDLVIGGIVLLFALKGFKRGFVAELAGAVAMAVAIAAAFAYRGQLDLPVHDYMHLAPDSAHVLGMVLYAVAAYVAVLVLAGVLGRVAKLPVIGIGNAVAGAAVGVCKAIVGTWAVLYVALFFPLSGQLRDDLRRSALVSYVTIPNERADDIVRATLPWFVRPFAAPLFSRHEHI